MATTTKTTKRMGRPKTAAGTGEPITVRVPPDLRAALDREALRLAKERPGSGTISRATVIREVCGRALLGGKRGKQ
jgi:hypothetical protein